MNNAANLLQQLQNAGQNAAPSKKPAARTEAGDKVEKFSALIHKISTTQDQISKQAARKLAKQEKQATAMAAKLSVPANKPAQPKVEVTAEKTSAKTPTKNSSVKTDVDAAAQQEKATANSTQEADNKTNATIEAASSSDAETVPEKLDDEPAMAKQDKQQSDPTGLPLLQAQANALLPANGMMADNKQPIEAKSTQDKPILTPLMAMGDDNVLASAKSAASPPLLPVAADGKPDKKATANNKDLSDTLLMGQQDSAVDTELDPQTANITAIAPAGKEVDLSHISNKALRDDKNSDNLLNVTKLNEFAKQVMEAAGNNLNNQPTTNAVADHSKSAAFAPLLASRGWQAVGMMAAQQIATPMIAAIKSGQEKMQVQLRPDYLGSVEITLHFGKEQQVTASIRAEKPETLELLRQDMSGLNKALQSAGIDLKSDMMQFSLMQQDSQQQRQSQQEAQQQAQRQAETRQWAVVQKTDFSEDATAILNSNGAQHSSNKGNNSLNIKI